jgi:hypothetical protein
MGYGTDVKVCDDMTPPEILDDKLVVKGLIVVETYTIELILTLADITEEELKSGYGAEADSEETITPETLVAPELIGPTVEEPYC